MSMFLPYPIPPTDFLSFSGPHFSQIGPLLWISLLSGLCVSLYLIPRISCSFPSFVDFPGLCCYFFLFFPLPLPYFLPFAMCCRSLLLPLFLPSPLCLVSHLALEFRICFCSVLVVFSVLLPPRMSSLHCSFAFFPPP